MGYLDGGVTYVKWILGEWFGSRNLVIPDFMGNVVQ
jgi:hypothetical protein